MPTVLVNQKKFTVTEGGILYDDKVEIIAGAKNLSAPGAVELDTLLHIQEIDKTHRLACRAKVLGDIKISY